MMENDLISRSGLWTDIMMLPHNGDIISSEEVEQAIVEAPAVDAVEVVRCKDCKHGVWNEDELMYQCVDGADYDPELAMYIGFICYEEADFFCKRGERRIDDVAD